MLSPRVEDYVGRGNAVRAIDAFVDTLDLRALGFKNSSGGLAPGQPAFDSAALLNACRALQPRHTLGDLAVTGPYDEAIASSCGVAPRHDR